MKNESDDRTRRSTDSEPPERASAGRECPLAGGTATIALQGIESAACPYPARQERVRSPPAKMLAEGAPLIGRGWCQVVQWESCARSSILFTHRAAPAALPFAHRLLLLAGASGGA